MECGTCGSQDTKYVTGVSKKNGKKWSAYDCQEPSCTGPSGTPTRTFVPFGSKPNASAKAPAMTPAPNETNFLQIINQKLDLILIKLKGLHAAPEETQDETPF